MGGYGLPIAETEHFFIYIHISCSNPHKSVSFYANWKDKDGKCDSSRPVDLEKGGYEENKDLDLLIKELDHGHDLVWIKEHGLRVIAEWEWKLQELEKENIEVKERFCSLRATLEAARKVLG